MRVLSAATSDKETSFHLLDCVSTYARRPRLVSVSYCNNFWLYYRSKCRFQFHQVCLKWRLLNRITEVNFDSTNTIGLNTDNRPWRTKPFRQGEWMRRYFLLSETYFIVITIFSLLPYIEFPLQYDCRYFRAFIFDAPSVKRKNPILVLYLTW